MVSRIQESVERDFVLEKIGGVFLLVPRTAAAEKYVAEICMEPVEHFAIWPILVLEPNEVEVIISELVDEGLSFL
jgi:hypothetical protein